MVEMCDRGKLLPDRAARPDDLRAALLTTRAPRR